MKIGAIEAQPGTKAYGAFKSGETHGRFDVHIPLHVIAGAMPGPTLVVQAGASGLEIEPSLILPRVAAELDPAAITGTVHSGAITAMPVCTLQEQSNNRSH